MILEIILYKEHQSLEHTFQRSPFVSYCGNYFWYNIFTGNTDSKMVKYSDTYIFRDTTLLSKGSFKLDIPASYWNMHMTHLSLLVDFSLIVITEISWKLMVLEMFLYVIMDLNQFLLIVSELVIQTSL